jgi:hypothetical protein
MRRPAPERRRSTEEPLKSLQAHGWLTIGTIALLLAPPACDGDGTGTGGAGGTGGNGGAGGDPGLPSVQGKLQYERVAHLPAGGLDYATVTTHPIRGVRVAVVDATSGAELGTAVSGDDGAYSIPLMAPASVKVWAYSETVEPAITVEDNTSGNAVYVLESAVTEVKGPTTVDVLGKTGWDGTKYSMPRSAAPFALLDAAYSGGRRFRDAVTPPPTFPALKVNWSVNNSPEDGDIEAGQIGISHWDGEEIYVLGRDGADTDEFDDHVVVHEWGHYFETAMSRGDSFGGSHYYGDVLDPRLAFSEGFGNALSAMILDPDTVYADSYGDVQSDGFAYDLEDADVTADASPGWFSEATVDQTWFDLYDPPNEPWDSVELGLAGVFALMNEDMKTTPALTTFFPLVAAARTRFPASAAAIDDLVEGHALDASYGVDPVQDEWGTGETHGGGIQGALPLYRDLAPNELLPLVLTGGQDSALLVSNRYLRVAGEGKLITVQSAAATDIDLYVFDHGQLIDYAESFGGDETVAWDGVTGKTYVVVVTCAEIDATPCSTDITRAP